jgi:hypothetical protein
MLGVTRDGGNPGGDDEMGSYWAHAAFREIHKKSVCPIFRIFYGFEIDAVPLGHRILRALPQSKIENSGAR